MILSGDEQIELVPIDRFLSSLPDDLRPRLVVLNTCSGGESGRGPSAVRMIAEHLRTMAIGWLGVIQDHAAVDFARFIYARILDGETMIDALRAYRLIQPSNRNFEQVTRDLAPVRFQNTYDAIPVVWTPSIALLTRPLLDLRTKEVEPAQEPKTTVKGVTRGAQPSRVETEPVVSSVSSFPTLTVEFEPQKWLNPALLKNGRPAINRLVLTADQAVRNVGVAVSCDTGNGISTVRQTINLEKGPYPVPIIEWQFPVLYELIGADVPRRQINFTVSCSLAGGFLVEVTKPVLWMGRAEWLDKPYELRYIAPPPILVYAPGDIFASGQRVRRLDEVVKRGRGTCHDLSILFASCLEQIQIYPLIMLITGHTFFGYWKDSEAHDDFWSRAGKNELRRPSDPGKEWTIIDRAEIQALLDRDVISLVDAVTVTDRNAKFEDAVQTGYKYFQETSMDPRRKFDVAIDIQASRRAVQPL